MTARRTGWLSLLVALFGCQASPDEPPSKRAARAYYSAPPDMTFSYCVNGKCSLIAQKSLADQKLIPLAVHHVCRLPDQYVLTFDDAPMSNMPKVLAILKEHDVRATFFVEGKRLTTTEFKGWVAQAFAAGHQIANHAFSHRDLRKLTDEEIAHEARETSRRIIEAIGHSDPAVEGARYVRPPFGYIDQRVQTALSSAGFESVRWNADRYDWKLGDEAAPVVLERVKQQLALSRARPPQNPSIIDVNHVYSSATTQALPEIIAAVRQSGYRFVTLRECLEIPSGP